VAGYSNTPLAKKLGIKERFTIVPVNAPSGYRALLEPLPASVRFTLNADLATDLVHIFSTRKRDLSPEVARCRERLDPSAVIWVSWPKKSAGVPTDVTEDTVRELALPLGLVDVKVCAIDDVWSGLKLVVRRELR
jgi:hypothetical protein